MATGEDFISGCMVKRAARRIRDAGDGYSRGYDDAITLALGILLEETGYVLEDILDYMEGEEG